MPIYTGQDLYCVFMNLETNKHSNNVRGKEFIYYHIYRISLMKRVFLYKFRKSFPCRITMANPPPIAPSPHDHQITALDLTCFARAELHDTNVICYLNHLLHD